MLKVPTGRLWTSRIGTQNLSWDSNTLASRVQSYLCDELVCVLMLLCVLRCAATTTAWTSSPTMTCSPPMVPKWPRDTRPASVWRTANAMKVRRTKEKDALTLLQVLQEKYFTQCNTLVKVNVLYPVFD